MHIGKWKLLYTEPIVSEEAHHPLFNQYNIFTFLDHYFSFSHPDGVDFCHDYSFWKTNCFNGSDATEYTHASQCSTYDSVKSIEELGEDCSNSYEPWGRKPNCPNSSTEKECSIKGNDYFYCKNSKTCIKSTTKCDGVVHCIKGEDEALEECKHLFHQSATLNCIEPYRPANDVWTKAILCDGITECKNEEDEKPNTCEKYNVCKNSLKNNTTHKLLFQKHAHVAMILLLSKEKT